MFTNLPQCSQSTNSLIYVYSIQILSCFLWVLDHNCDHYSSYYCCPPKISVLAPLMYGSWDIRHNSRQSFLLIWAIFCPLTSYQPEKLKFWKKKAWRYHHFKLVYHKWWWNVPQSHMYGSWSIECDTGLSLRPARSHLCRQAHRQISLPAQLIVQANCTKNHVGKSFFFSWKLKRTLSLFFFCLS